MVSVLNFISGRNLGGSKQAFLDYTLMCSQRGFEVHSMIRTRSPLKGMLLKMSPSVAANIIEVNYVRLKWPLFKQWALRQFKKATVDVYPDVILVHKPIDLFFIRKTFPNIKIVGVLHSFTAKHLHNADHMFVVSQALKNFIIDQGCKVPVSVINNAIYIPPLSANLNSRDTPVIGTMAVFRRTKRLDLLLKSFHQLKQQNVTFRGIIAGAGIQKIYLKFLIWRWGLADCVELRPWVVDKELFYKDIDIFCITSRSETFSISLIEAMARKKCVVATACGGPNEIIEDQVDGLLSPVGCAASLTKNLAMLINSRPRRDQLAKHAYHKAQNCYSSDVIQKKIGEHLNLLVGQKTLTRP